jgi:hypothetical protein
MTLRKPRTAETFPPSTELDGDSWGTATHSPIAVSQLVVRNAERGGNQANFRMKRTTFFVRSLNRAVVKKLPAARLFASPSVG